MLTPPEFGIFGQETALFGNAGMEFTANLLLRHPGLVVGGTTNLSDCVPQPILNDRQHNNLRSVLNNARDKAKNKNANYAIFLSQVETDAWHRPTKIADDSLQNLATIKNQMEPGVGTNNVHYVVNFVQRFLVDVENTTGGQLDLMSRSRLAHYILDDLTVTHDTSQLSTSERLKYLADYFLNQMKTGSMPLGLELSRKTILTQTAEDLLNLLGGVDKSQAPTTLLPEKIPTPPPPKEISGGGGFASRLEHQIFSNGPLWTQGWDHAYKILHVDDLFGLIWARGFYGDVKKTKGGLIAGPREWLGVYGALVREMGVSYTSDLSAAKVRLLTLAHIISSVGGLQNWQNIGSRAGHNEVLALCDRAIEILKLEWKVLDNMKPRKGSSAHEAVLRTIYGEGADTYFSTKREELIYKRYGVLFKGLGLIGNDLKIAEEISQSVLL